MNNLSFFNLFKIRKKIIIITVNISTTTIGNFEVYNSGIFTYMATLDIRNKLMLKENQINVYIVMN